MNDHRDFFGLCGFAHGKIKLLKEFFDRHKLKMRRQQALAFLWIF